ncbi:TMV resistance protein N-like [Dorcoceras hygrometricum]|uniref:TMV resistance protein N-like n=1 Tax=Dorcoceras hygrometricum TaxID=472368 RepID=A0A2Z7AX53_9LAMI|nr:TMV resistance protein N-like [Dorcoceras hygrometricum]
MSKSVNIPKVCVTRPSNSSSIPCPRATPHSNSCRRIYEYALPKIVGTRYVNRPLHESSWEDTVSRLLR